MTEGKKPETIGEDDLNEVSGGPVFDFGTIYYPGIKKPSGLVDKSAEKIIWMDAGEGSG